MKQIKKMFSQLGFGEFLDCLVLFVLIYEIEIDIKTSNTENKMTTLMVTAKLALVQFMVLGLRELGDSSTSGTSKAFFPGV